MNHTVPHHILKWDYGQKYAPKQMEAPICLEPGLK